MKIYSVEDPIEDAVEALADSGLVVVEGTKTPALKLMDQIIAALSDDAIEPIQSYLNTPQNGYLYFIYDGNRFCRDDELKKLVDAVDRANPPL